MTRPVFESEADLAAHVRGALERRGWTVYPETNGWDLFAVHEDGYAAPQWQPDVQPGDQLGVETKLRPSWRLIEQVRPPTTFEPYLHVKRGPHFRVAALSGPYRQAWRDLDQTLQSMGVSLWVAGPNNTRFVRFGYRHNVEASLLHHVPELVVDVPAGVPSPRTAGAWKTKAVRIMLRLRHGEEMTTQDIAAAGISPSTFRQRLWIQDSGKRRGRSYIWEPGPGTTTNPPPDVQWPEIAAALKEVT